MTFQVILLCLIFLRMLHLWYVNQELENELQELNQKYKALEISGERIRTDIRTNWLNAQNRANICNAELSIMEEEISDLNAQVKKLKNTPLNKLLNIKLPKRRK